MVLAVNSLPSSRRKASTLLSLPGTLRLRRPTLRTLVSC